MYSHSQLAVLPPHTHTHIFSNGKESLLRCRQPLWINSVVLSVLKHSQQAAVTVLNGSGGSNSKRSLARGRRLYQNGFLVKLNFRLLIIFLRVYNFTLLTANFICCRLILLLFNQAVWVQKADHLNVDTKFLSHQSTQQAWVSLAATRPVHFFCFHSKPLYILSSTLGKKKKKSRKILITYCMEMQFQGSFIYTSLRQIGVVSNQRRQFRTYGKWQLAS